ncbi:MAG: hypothetical protein KDN05_06730 [Verrucomicrobiae bacterium]|nr:hypothetical protein [Verrucomicrobiae bacterium]
MKDWASTGAMGSGSRRILHRRMREELRTKLLSYDFTHFITLTSNHQPLGYLRMRNLLKEWDARVNREINGRKWTRRPDERLVWFAFPEKIDVNPHWHMIVQVDPCIENAARAERTERLPEIGHMHWLSLVRQGSFDCQGVESAGVIGYITKMSADETHFEKFVVFREFMNI